MNQRRLYSRAPITEALIDIQVKLPVEVTFETLSALRDFAGTNYPKHRIQTILQSELSLESQGAVVNRQTEDGHILLSGDEKQIVQGRLDGFTFSRLAPYDRWETLRDEARRLWDGYCSIARPEQLTRVAIRYVNRLDFPLPLRDFKDYLRTVPEVSSDLPQDLSGYFMQLQIPQIDLEAMLLLNQATIPPPGPDLVSLLLDIDLFRRYNLPADEATLWGVLEQLHVRSDEVFEACITDLTRELIR